MVVRKIIFLGIFFCLSACRDVIVHDLTESEANKMLTHLLNTRFDVKKEKQADGQWSLSLPQKESARAIKVLSDNRMLKQESNPLPSKNGLMSSREEQRFIYERALSREIEATLSAMAGVLQARVHLNLPVQDPFFGQNIDNSKSSASVLLVVGNEIFAKTDIVSLVSGASGIPASAVSVITTRSNQSEDTAVAVLQSEAISTESTIYLEQIPESQQQKSLNIAGLMQEYGRALFLNFPWSWTALVIGTTLLIMLVIRFIYRSEKIAI